MRHTLVALSLALTLSTSAFAQTAQDLADLSRAEFLQEYEQRFQNSMLVQQELLARLSPEFRASINTDPVTDAEREGFACMYDAMEQENQLIAIAQQLLAYDVLEDKMNTDPAFDLVSTMFDQEFMESFANEIPDEAFSAMSDCGLITLSSQRMNFTPELWTAISQAAQERGYSVD